VIGSTGDKNIQSRRRSEKGALKERKIQLMEMQKGKIKTRSGIRYYLYFAKGRPACVPVTSSKILTTLKPESSDRMKKTVYAVFTNPGFEAQTYTSKANVISTFLGLARVPRSLVLNLFPAPGPRGHDPRPPNILVMCWCDWFCLDEA
jgi:hypothetical protein